MRKKGVTLKKTCSFYVSEFHLSTLLLPYIVTKVKSNVYICTFLEESIKENITKVVKGINMEEYTKKEILKINWEKVEKIKYEELLKQFVNEYRDINIIVNGSKKYIEDINMNLNKLIKELNFKGLNNKIKINNCYQVSEVLSVKEILDKHDLLLNTSGEIDIEDVFKEHKISDSANCKALHASE